MVSTKHSNFIVNMNQASSQDVMALIQHIKGSVFNAYGIDLQLEVQIK